MEYILRKYQIEAIEKGLNFFKSSFTGGALMVLPTGSGKSLIIANIVKQLNEDVLIFQPTKEILEQNYKKLLNYNVNASIYSASFNSKKIDKITFATIGSVKSNPKFFKHFNNIIIDECHLINAKAGMYKEFFDIIGDKILGLTATPYRLTTDGWGGSILKFLTRTRPRIFKKMIYYVQNGRLFDENYLAKLEYYQIKGFDTGRLELNSTGADYTDQSVINHFEEIHFDNKLQTVIGRLIEIGRKNILVFTRFTKEAQAIVNKFNGLAEIVTAKTKKKERDRIINNFKNGTIRIVANVGILTLGFDFPELETIVIARPTRSLALYYQMIGRGIRIHKDKKTTYIIDMCQNYNRFGKVENLEITSDKPDLWYIKNNNKQLTNVYYE